MAPYGLQNSGSAAGALGNYESLQLPNINPWNSFHPNVDETTSWEVLPQQMVQFGHPHHCRGKFTQYLDEYVRFHAT